MKYFAHMTPLAVFATLTALAPAQSIGGDLTLRNSGQGRVAGDQFCNSISDAGDFNGDGIPDIIVGGFYLDPGGVYNAGAATVYSGLDASFLFQWAGTASSARLGNSVSKAGDINGDGFDDVIVGAPGIHFGGISNSGSAFVYSGADGTQLHRWNGTASRDNIGYAVSGAGDVNGDGVPDVVLGSYLATAGGLANAGLAKVYSGADGALLYHWEGANETDHFGSSISGAGDTNGDGYDDLLIGAEAASPGGRKFAGSVFLYSGADGSILHRFDGEAAGDGFGSSVCDGGDINQDGFPDLIVASPYAEPGGIVMAGAVYIYSGFDGAQLFKLKGQVADGRFGLSVSSSADFDKDGIPEVIVGAPNHRNHLGTAPGSTFIYSGADMTMLYQFEGENIGDTFGETVSGIGDVSGYGIPGVLIGAPHADDSVQLDVGKAYHYAFDPFLKASGTEISIAAGGRVDFELDFPSESAGFEYKLLASLSGTGPFFYGVDIPLTYDPIVQLTWDGQNPGVVEGNMHGTLDAEGSASAFIDLSPGARPYLIGLTLQIAAVALPSGGLPEFSSVAVPLNIIP